MYKVYCDGNTLYDPRDEDLPVTAAKVSQAVNCTGEFTFTLPPTHPLSDRIRKRKSIVRVYDDDERLFEGRVLESKATMYNMRSFTCEGDMAYLLDSIQRPKEYHNLTPESYLRDKIAQHNSQVEEEKQFVIGTVEKKIMNYDARQDNQYTNTLDTIMDKLLSSNGGYLRVRYQDNIRYLDYLESYGRTSLQTIRFGENVLDLTEHISVADVITVLIPLGKAAESESGENGSKLTIESVNDGKDYLEDLEAIALYGRIVGTQTWDDVTVPENLKIKGQEYLENARNLSMTIELTAVDLHVVDVDIDRIKLGDMVRVVSPPHGLDRYMLVSKREYNLLNPSEDKITLGDTIAALTEKQAALQKSVEKQESSAEVMENLRSSMTTLVEDVNTAKENVSGLDGRVQFLEGSSIDIEKEIQEIKNRLAGLSSMDTQLQDAIVKIEERLKVLEEV